jgi:diguanylate cyclase (GGDEF)-like protein
MPEINPFFSQLVRTDALTNTGNHVSFFDWLINIQSKEPFAPFTLVSTDMRGLKPLNVKSGRQAGDTALRWAANIIREHSKETPFRMGSEFIVIINHGTPQDQAIAARSIYDTLNAQAPTAGLSQPAANVVGITFFEKSQCTPENVLSAYYGALFFLQQKTELSFRVFDARQMTPVTGFMGYVISHTISRFTSIGSSLDQSNQLAFIDTISNLPNARAAILQLQEAIDTAQIEKTTFSVLIIDGDNLRPYNKLSYVGGDDMIRRLAETLAKDIRPTDYIARWRKGDQFLVILPNSDSQSGAAVGERMRVAVDQASKEWMIRTSISVGVAGCPHHGKTVAKLIEVASSALSRAKELGKNRVAVFP